MATLSETIFSLEKERDALKDELEKIEDAISILKKRIGSVESKSVGAPQVLNNSGSSEPIKIDGLRRNMTIAAKVGLIISQTGRFMHIREIAKVFAENGGLNNLQHESSISRKLASPISAMRAKGQLAKVIVNNVNRNTFWGLPSWLDNIGEIKTGYEYKKELLVDMPVDYE